MFQQQELKVATDAARAGARALLKFFRQQNNIRLKASCNLVSEADLESESAIRKQIHRVFPDHAFLGEESDDANPDATHLWVVDPLDGTNNFCHGIEHFAVSIAFYRNGQPQLGVVHCPVSDDWYVAGLGHGAFHNNAPAGVTRDKHLSETLIGTGFYYDRGEGMRQTLGTIEELFAQNIHGIRRMGTASLDLCMVGTGRFGGYFEFELSWWDYAAGKLFVEEAGGKVTDCNGLDFSRGMSSVVAANADLHPQLMELIKPRFQHSLAEKS